MERKRETANEREHFSAILACFDGAEVNPAPIEQSRLASAQDAGIDVVAEVFPVDAIWLKT